MKSVFPNSKSQWLLFIKNTALIILGTFTLAFGASMFIFPFDLVTGGVSGLGIICESVFKDMGILEGIGADTYSAIINWTLFGVGFLILGKAFALKTLVSTAVYPIALWISNLIIYESPLASLLDLNVYMAEYGEIVLIIATVFGGAFIGAGCAFTFLGGGSTGGVDVIALALAKYIRRLKNSVSFFICDAIIVIVGIFAVHNLILSLLGIISAFICAISIDKLFLGESSAFIAHIVSEKYSEINDAVIHKMNRTTTILDAIGGYSGEGKKMVIVTFPMRQYPAFRAMINNIDKNAFITIHRAHEIEGEGWTYNVEPF